MTIYEISEEEQARGFGHDSDCAVFNAPAEEAGLCDCGASYLPCHCDDMWPAHGKDCLRRYKRGFAEALRQQMAVKP